MLPAAGQGALGIEVRTDALALREALGTLTDRKAWFATQAERAYWMLVAPQSARRDEVKVFTEWVRRQAAAPPAHA